MAHDEQPRPEPGVTYRTVKGALLGPGSGIETPEQADRVVRALRGLPPELIAEAVAVQGFPLNVTAGQGRPCCHATGPNHHPACTTNRTEQQ